MVARLHAHVHAVGLLDVFPERAVGYQEASKCSHVVHDMYVLMLVVYYLLT